MVNLIITDNEAGQRLDRFLKKYLKRASLSMIYKMIRKDIKLNGKRAKEDTMLAVEDVLSFYISEEQLKELSSAKPKKSVRRQFKVAYEDENLLIVEKPWGLLTHGDAHEKKNTLANQVCGYLQEKGDYDPARERTFTPSPVNRLDRNTTGLVIFGKNAETLRTMTRLIRERDYVHKYYMTIVAGCFREPMVFQDRLEKDERKNQSMVVGELQGRDAVTDVRPLISGTRFSLVEVGLITGRTHQIRVHLSHAGYPLAGDAKYGNQSVNERVKREVGITTQLLHACRLEFENMPQPFAYLNGMKIEASVPEAFRQAEKKLVKESAPKSTPKRTKMNKIRGDSK